LDEPGGGLMLWQAQIDFSGTVGLMLPAVCHGIAEMEQAIPRERQPAAIAACVEVSKDDRSVWPSLSKKAGRRHRQTGVTMMGRPGLSST
jgi:hypothetical protein